MIGDLGWLLTYFRGVFQLKAPVVHLFWCAWSQTFWSSNRYDLRGLPSELPLGEDRLCLVGVGVNHHEAARNCADATFHVCDVAVEFHRIDAPHPSAGFGRRKSRLDRWCAELPARRPSNVGNGGNDGESLPPILPSAVLIMGCDRSVDSGWRVRSQETSVEAAKDLTVAGVRAAQPSGGIDSRSTGFIEQRHPENPTPPVRKRRPAGHSYLRQLADLHGSFQGVDARCLDRKRDVLYR